MIADWTIERLSLGPARVGHREPELGKHGLEAGELGVEQLHCVLELRRRFEPIVNP